MSKVLRIDFWTNVSERPIKAAKPSNLAVHLETLCLACLLVLTAGVLPLVLLLHR